MIKKIISVLLIMSLIAVCFCACGDDDELSLVMPIESDPLCIDPQAVESDEGKLIVANCYEGLVRYDENYKLVPGVAESWTVSADGLTYTFKLRSDTHWQKLKSFTAFFEKDGDTEEDKEEAQKQVDKLRDTVTAYDFQFGLRRALNPATKCDEAEKLLCIKNAKAVNDGTADVETLGVVAKDDTTLVITLERANPDFLRLLTIPAAMPCHEEFFNLTHAKYGLALTYSFCNGPFYLARWAEDNSLVMMKNEGYVGNSETTVDAVYLSVNTDESTYATRFKQDTYDVLYTNDELLTELNESKDADYTAIQNSVSGLCFNCSDAVLTNENIRKAFVMITKFDEINQPTDAYGKANGIVPDCCRFGEQSYRDAAGKLSNLAYNEAKAIELWQKGIKEVGTDSVEIKIICTEEYTAQMQNVIQNWQKLLGTSIIAKVEAMEQDDFDTAVRNGNYQIAVGTISTESANAVDVLKQFTSDSSSNIFNYNSEKYDKLVDGIINTDSGDAILKNCKAAEQMIINDAVFCPLYTNSELIAINNEIDGIFAMPAFEAVFFQNGGRK